jgi:hypothetical protein
MRKEEDTRGEHISHHTAGTLARLWLWCLMVLWYVSAIRSKLVLKLLITNIFIVTKRVELHFSIFK